MNHKQAMAYARQMHDPLFEGSLILTSGSTTTTIDAKVGPEREHRRKTDRGWEIVMLRTVESSTKLYIDDQLTIEGFVYSCESVQKRDDTRSRATFRRIEVGELGRAYDTR